MSRFNKMNKEQFLDAYIDVCKALGKIASFLDAKRFGLSERQIKKHFGNITNLKYSAIEKQPLLQDIAVPPNLQVQDLLKNYRLNLEKQVNTKNNLQKLKQVNQLDYIENFVKDLKIPQVKPYKIKGSNGKTERILTVFLSDLHFGADVNEEETGVNHFGKIEEARRLALIVKEVLEYKEQHRDKTELEVVLGGDNIQGALGHDPRDGAPLAEQMARALYLLQQALVHFSAHFKKVRVRCTTGNHGRNISRHSGRATKQKWDSFETILCYSLKQAFLNVKNVEFFIPKTPYITYEVFGKKVYVTHGDTNINVGNPHKSINISNIENQINKINASLKDHDEYSLFLVGHVHSPNMCHLANGSTVITNGCLVGSDDFSVSLGSFETVKGQWVFESVKDHVVGDSRFIRITKETDLNSDLDKIIKPWSSF